MQLGNKGGNECKFRYRSGKLVIEGGNYNLIILVAIMVLDAKGWDCAWK
jgi:hypothetical protein